MNTPDGVLYSAPRSPQAAAALLFSTSFSLLSPLPSPLSHEGLPGNYSRVTHRSGKGDSVLFPLPGRERARACPGRDPGVRVESPESLPSPEPPTPPPQKRRSSPLVMPPPAPAFRRPEFPRHRLFLPLPVGEGRGEGLPGTHSRVTHRSGKGDSVLFPLPGRVSRPDTW